MSFAQEDVSNAFKKFFFYKKKKNSMNCSKNIQYIVKFTDDCSNN